MSKKLDERDFREHLREQIYFLQSSAQQYDLGHEIEAKRMATQIRVLVWGEEDRTRYPSLLGQMHLKKKMEFISTAQKYSDTNLLSQQCLLQMHIEYNHFKYVPLFENDNCFRLLAYTDWIEEIVLSDNKKNVYRRKDVLSLLANKDGGAHVDANIPEKVARMKSKDFGGWELKTPTGDVTYGNDPVYATMRQMAFEMLQSLYLVRPQLFEERYF